MRWQNYRVWHSHPYAQCEGVVKKLLIRTPPKWIVDYGCSANSGILKIGSVKRNILRNTVYYYRIFSRFALSYFFNRHGLRCNSTDLFLINTVDKSLGEGVFLSEENSDFLHFVIGLWW